MGPSVSRQAGLYCFSGAGLPRLRHGLGTRRLGKRRDGHALVPHLDDLQVFDASRGFEDDGVTWSGLHQRARQRRHPADLVTFEIDFVDADDRHDPFHARGVLVPDGRAKENVRGGPAHSTRFWVHDFR